MSSLRPEKKVANISSKGDCVELLEMVSDGQCTSGGISKNGRVPVSHYTTFLDLPVEVRHEIYRYLFCHAGSPVWLPTVRIGLETLEPSEPTFHTQLFRVSRSIYLDAVAFAYSANDFVLRDSFLAFCGLGPVALSSVKHLTIVHSSWTVELPMEDQAWKRINSQCLNLQFIEIDLHADLLIELVPFLEHFFTSLRPEGTPPSLLLDLYVWERYFTFDSGDGDFRRSSSLLRASRERTGPISKPVDPRTRVLRLPKSPQDIVLSADVNEGAIQALDAFLYGATRTRLIKKKQDLPKTGRRSYGRSARYCYVWDSAQRGT